MGSFSALALFVFGVRLGPGVVVVDEELLSLSSSSSSSPASEKGDAVEREYEGDSVTRLRLLALLCRGVNGWPRAETSTDVLDEAVDIGSV